MRLLWIEDEPEKIESAIDAVINAGLGIQYRQCGFEQTEQVLLEYLPDLIILDLLAGLPQEVEGIKPFDFIWNKRFCPIIIYSAQPELLTDPRCDHPLIRKLQKGSESIGSLKVILREFIPHVEVINDAESYIRQSFALALKDVVPLAFQVVGDAAQRKDIILRSARRRLAALMDELSISGDMLVNWEQYLCPPLSKYPLLGDVIQEYGKSADDETSFRIVLTPSCDLAGHGAQGPKAKNVLVARCCSAKDGLMATSLGSLKDDHENRIKLKRFILSQGYFETIMLLPRLIGKIPSMAAKMKDLELVPIGELIGEGKKYIRIASIDSPFRELVSWAYMQSACRPGLPERDREKWCEEIMGALKSASK
jgi:hypothetical protein